MKYYTVGGAVRDRLLGRPIRDTDIVFDGTEEDFLQRNPRARKIKDSLPAIFLLDGSEYTALNPDGLNADMHRRDFTINALALAEDGFLHSHPLALQDLRNRIIRPASFTALYDDPVRVLRAARFTASLPDFSLHDDTIAAIQAVQKSNLPGTVAAEAAGMETMKACLAEKPGNYLRSLAKARALSPWFKELESADAIPAGPSAYHSESLLAHIAHTMDLTSEAALAAGFSAANDPVRLTAVWMALCHDLGKSTTQTDMLPRHIGHEFRGEALAFSLGSRLRLSNALIKAGVIASRQHMKAGRYFSLRSGSKVDLLMTLYTAHIFTPFFLMVSQDSHLPDLSEEAARDLQCILSVHLPEKWRNLGDQSGIHLRQMRCSALIRSKNKR